MKLSDMFTILNAYVDDVVAATVATAFLNAGQNEMASEIKGAFPQLTATNLDDTFVFPEKYHEIPILYAAAMVKAQDSSIREKESFLNQFNQKVKVFTENYDLPAQYRDDVNSQQYVSTAGQTSYTITKDLYVPDYSNLKVYVNDIRIYTFTASGNVFTLKSESLLDDKVTAVWDIDHAMQEPPYPWQGVW
jgi:hypothetical protein